MDDLHIEPVDAVVRSMKDAQPQDIQKSLDQLLLNLRRAGVSADEETKAIDQLRSIASKCDLEDWRPYGGATSFAEVEAWIASMDKTSEVNELSYEFQSIVDNIWRMEDVDVIEKASRIAAAAGDLKNRLNATARKENSLIARVRALVSGDKGMIRKEEHVVTEWYDVDPEAADSGKAVSDPGTLAVFKDADGKWRYVAVATNCYRDKEKERFPAEAHKDYVDYVDKTGDFPDLVLWHDLSAKVGKADCVYYDEETGFRVSTGTFDAGMEDVAERLAAMPNLAMSHGFIFRKNELVDGMYKRYRSFEETILPEAKYAANEATAFIAAREAHMIPDAKRKFFEATLGPSRLAMLESSLGERAATMNDEELGAALKSALVEAPAAAPADTVQVAAENADKTVDLVESVKAALPDIVAAGLKSVVEPLNERLAAIETKQASLEAALAESKKSDDERVAAMFGVRALNPGAITPPSEDKGNVVTKAAAEKIVGDLDDGADGGTPQGTNPHLAGIVGLLRGSLGAPVAAG